MSGQSVARAKGGGGGGERFEILPSIVWLSRVWGWKHRSWFSTEHDERAKGQFEFIYHVQASPRRRTNTSVEHGRDSAISQSRTRTLWYFLSSGGWHEAKGVGRETDVGAWPGRGVQDRAPQLYLFLLFFFHFFLFYHLWSLSNNNSPGKKIKEKETTWFSSSFDHAVLNPSLLLLSLLLIKEKK